MVAFFLFVGLTLALCQLFYLALPDIATVAQSANSVSLEVGLFVCLTNGSVFVIFF